MFLRKLIINISCVLLSLSTLLSQTDSPDASITVPRDSIIIASEPDYPPYCFVNDQGKADGFAVDLFKAAVDAVGLHATIKIGIWSKIKEDLAEGKIDALPLVGKTPEREPFYDFTLPYLSLHGAIFVREDTDDIRSLADLKQKEVVVMKGDNAEEFIRREQVSDYIYTTNTFEEAFQQLANGQHDAVITQRITGLNLLENLNLESDVKPLNIQLPEFRQDFCFAVKKGDTQLLSLLNEGLSIIIANNKFEEIRLKWFGPAVKEKLSFWDIAKVILYGLIPIAILLTVLMILILRREVRERTKSLKEEINLHKATLAELQNQKEVSQLNEEQIKLILNSTAEGIYGIDLNGNCTFINESALKILGYNTQDDLLGKNMHQYLHHSKRDGTRFSLKECKINKALLEGTEARVNDEVFWCADGTNFDVEYTAHTVKKEGKVVGAVITFWDITESKKMTDKLRETKEYLENLITYANSPIIVWNSKLEIERFNKAFERITGREYAEVIGKNVNILFPSDQQNDVSKLIEKTIKGKRWDSVELEVQHVDGERKTVLWNSANIYDEEHKTVIATIAQGHDITLRKSALYELEKIKEELEVKVAERTMELQDKVAKLDKSQKAMLFMVEDLNELTAELKSERHKLEISNKELEAFSYSVSHDLRAPLRAIDGFSKFIFEDYSDKLDEEGKRLLKVIRDNANTMDRLIADMLNLSRLSRKEMNLSKVDMKAIAFSMYMEVTSPVQKDQFEFVIEENMPFIEVDPSLIKQVWQNLISNSLKYSSNSTKKRIEIGSDEESDKVIFWIKDYGAGFNEKYSSKLFGVFQRLHSSTEFEGTGVGLSIVQRIIHRHGGEVWAEGEINKGAKFYFSLPKTKLA